MFFSEGLTINDFYRETSFPEGAFEILGYFDYTWVGLDETEGYFLALLKR